MNLQLYDIDEDQIGKRGVRKSGGERYSGYRKALEPHIDWIVGQINANPKGRIVVRRDEFSRDLGFKLRDEKTKKGGLSEAAFSWGTGGVLFIRYGIKMESGHISGGVPVYILRMRTEDDTLPESQAKLLNVDIYGKPKEGGITEDVDVGEGEETEQAE